MLREEPGVLALGKAVVEEQHHALIFLRPDDPPGGLQDFVHPGPAVGVVEARPVLGVVVAAQHLLAGTHLRQAHAHDGAADEPVAREVHALAEDAAHDPEAEKRLLRAGRKPLEERRPPGVVQTALLYQCADVRVAGGEVLPHLPQIGIAGEESQIVAHPAGRQRREGVRDGPDAGVPLAVAGGDGGQTVEPEVFCREGAFQRHGPGFGTAEDGAVVARRRQRRAEQRRRPPCRKACVHEGGRVEAEQLQFKVTAPGGELGGKMLVVPFRRPQDVLHLKVEIQQGRVGFGVGIVFQPVLQGSRQRPQRGQQG